MNLIDKVLQEEMMIEDTHTIIDSDFSFVDGFMNEFHPKKKKIFVILF